jgi:hypothetical protein
MKVGEGIYVLCPFIASHFSSRWMTIDVKLDEQLLEERK